MKKLITILLGIFLLSGCQLQPPFGGGDLALADKYNQSQIKNKYQLEGTKLKRAVKDNPKDMVRVEIGEQLLGGAGDTTLEPKLTISRWDEVSFSIKPKNYDKVLLKNKAVKFEGDKTVFETPKENYQLYEMPVSEENPEGAFEYQINLKEKPTTNKIEFTLETQGLDFFYQPELTQKEKDEGAFRPENVVGSYAVYASEQKTNWTGGKEYKVGKVGHIFRPKIIDSAGTEVWGDLHIENGILSVTIPQDFLDKAVYPVRHAAGLTFGYTSAGASTANIYYNASYADSAYIEGSDYTLTEAGTVSKLSVYISAIPSGGSDNSVYGGIFPGGSTLPFERIGESVSKTGITTTGDYKDLVYGTPVDLSAGDYKLCCYADSDGVGNYSATATKYDALGGTNSVQRNTTGVSNVTSMANTLTNSGNGNGPVLYYISTTLGTRKPSIYATYTAGAPANTCTYSGTGNWNALQADNCYITSTVYVNGDFNLIGNAGGTGSFGCAPGVKVSATAYNMGTGKTSLDAHCFAHH